MAIVLAPMVGGGVITTDTPPYEFDSTTTAGTTYVRYELSTAVQYIEKITASTKTKTQDLWANRATATYVPINS